MKNYYCYHNLQVRNKDHLRYNSLRLLYILITDDYKLGGMTNNYILNWRVGKVSILANKREIILHEFKISVNDCTVYLIIKNIKK